MVEGKVRQNGITLECCVTSNIQTRAFASAGEHPLLRLLRSGMAVTVNTDNMTVSGTTIAKEFEILKECGMTDTEKRQLLKNSAEAAFLEDEKKRLLMEKVLKR